ncbi:MAG: hypothetical protein WCW32_02320 [Candidatus Paceibacterota bacterium]
MKLKYFVCFVAVSFLVTGFLIPAGRVFAQLSNIQYPVEELGGCKDEESCRSFCDDPANLDACLSFGEKNNLMSGEEIKLAKKFEAAGKKGPGGCKDKASCEAFCDDMANIDECVTFAEKNNLMSPQELAEAKKVKEAIGRGVKPPSCGNKKACDAYCEDPDHMEECITFGVEAGFIQGKELEDSQKMLAALKKGVKPPPCRGKEACDEYCSSPDNMEVCMNFAMEAGFMSDEEKANSQKMLQAVKKGIKPPACKGRDECDAYCAEESHFEECIAFSEAAGFMNPEEAKMARKTGGKGPGGCKGKSECEAFCNDVNNQETCFNFAKENGMIPEEDLKRMEEGKQKFKGTLEEAPTEVLDCLDSKLGTDMMEQLKSGAVMPPREIGDKMRECFEKMGPGEPGSGGMIPPAGQTGPGGCMDEESCKAYCESNPEGCQKFQPGPGEMNPGGQIMPQQAGPGGCKGPDECKVYCESNPEECKNFGNSGGNQFAPGTGPSDLPNGQTIQGGQPSEFKPGPGNCQNPEECQQRQEGGNPPLPPKGCEGENCMQGPPPNYPGDQSQPGGNPPNPPQDQIPPGDMQPPAGSFPPGDNPPPPGENPPPPGDNPPPPDGSPTSMINNGTLLGALLNLFLSALKQ